MAKVHKERQRMHRCGIKYRNPYQHDYRTATTVKLDIRFYYHNYLTLMPIEICKSFSISMESACMTHLHIYVYMNSPITRI